MIPFVIIVFFLSFGAINAQGHTALAARIMEKKEKLLHNPQIREKKEQQRTRIKALVQKCKEHVKQHKIAEEIRKQKQEAFNNRMLYQLEISPENPLYTLVIHNSDICKGLFVLLDWGIEWCLYQRILTCWAEFASNYIAKHKQELLDPNNTPESLVKAINSKEFIGQMMHDFLPAMVAYLCMGQLSDALRHHFLLDRTSTQNIATLLIANLVGAQVQGPIPLFDFIESNINIPLTMVKTGLLDQANDYLKNFKLFNIKLFPDWTQKTSFLVTKRIVFMGLFMRWSIKKFLEPLLIATITKNKKEFIDKHNKEEIKELIMDSQKGHFPQWLTLKSERYSIWQTTVNVAIMVPTVAPKIYQLIKFILTKKEAV